jgi:ketopantoate reductase
MAAITSYAEILKRIIREYAEIRPSYGDVQVEMIFDDAPGHYELMYAGWHDSPRIHGSVIHADIRDGKVWIQHDGTQQGIAGELVEAGIPKEHITG